jgi:hypothetical protein
LIITIFRKIEQIISNINDQNLPKVKRKNTLFEKIKGVYSKVKEKIKTKSNVVLNKFGRISHLME